MDATTKNAIVSVWDKNSFNAMAHVLIRNGFTIISTGTTFNELQNCLAKKVHCQLKHVSDFTGFPLIMGGRVNGLHPIIHAGISARDDQVDELRLYRIERISVVIVNTCSFAEAINKCGRSEANLMEFIDVGAHALIRSAAKNYQRVLVIVDPADYVILEKEGTTVDERRKLAIKAFSYVAEYDIAVARYFGDETVRKYQIVNDSLDVVDNRCNNDNFHGGYARIYKYAEKCDTFRTLNGIPDYNNMYDALLAYSLVCEATNMVKRPVAACFKHRAPVGVGMGMDLTELEEEIFDVSGRKVTTTCASLIRARNCDPQSSRGDFIAMSHNVDFSTAQIILRDSSVGIIAPGYDNDAMDVLCKKNNNAYIILQQKNIKATSSDNGQRMMMRDVCNVTLARQQEEMSNNNINQFVTINKHLHATILDNLILASVTAKYARVDASVMAFHGQVIGISTGQPNTMDSIKHAGQKAERWCARFTDRARSKFFDIKQKNMPRDSQFDEICDFVDSIRWEKTTKELCLVIVCGEGGGASHAQVASTYGVKYIAYQCENKLCDTKIIVM